MNNGYMKIIQEFEKRQKLVNQKREEEIINKQIH